MMNKTIPVTQPFLPELNEFVPYLEKIWDNRWLTNNGPFHQELEAKLAELARIRDGLRTLIKACPGHGALDACPILHALNEDAA